MGECHCARTQAPCNVSVHVLCLGRLCCLALAEHANLTCSTEFSSQPPVKDKGFHPKVRPAECEAVHSRETPASFCLCQMPPYGRRQRQANRLSRCVTALRLIDV